MYFKYLFLLLFLSSTLYPLTVRSGKNAIIPHAGSLNVIFNVINDAMTIKGIEVNVSKMTIIDGKQQLISANDDFILDPVKIVLNPEENINVNAIFIGDTDDNEYLYYRFRIKEIGIKSKNKLTGGASGRASIVPALDIDVIVRSLNYNSSFTTKLIDCSDDESICTFQFKNLGSSRLAISLNSLVVSNNQNESDDFEFKILDFKEKPVKLYPNEYLTYDVDVSNLKRPIRDYSLETKYTLE